MPILDGSDDGEFFTEENYNFQDPDARWQDGRDTMAGYEVTYPTPWTPIDNEYGIEYRHLAEDMYQLRSLTHIVAVSQEGFITYIRDRTGGFEKWCKDNNIKIEERET